MIHDAIVLLGFSGVGKDTTFDVLDKRYPRQFTNAKFSSLMKALVANALDIDPSALEDKSIRQEPIWDWFSLSPMDLLTALFKGFTPKLTEVSISFLFHHLPNFRLPVFTDIRRHRELAEVKSRYSNPLIVYLWSRNVDEGVNDSQVEEIAFTEDDTIVICRDNMTATDVANVILKYLGDPNGN